jgi:hypothetical protein
MPKLEKVRAKIVTADARAERDLAAVRAQAERKIVKIREELRAREAKITARLESKRGKAEAKLGSVKRAISRDGSNKGYPRAAEPASGRNRR